MNTFFVGAILSDLTSSGKLKISKARVGGSPVYYLPGQENKLGLLRKSLKEPEQQAYDLLLDKKLLRDSELEPITRVALREIKDFAVMLNVNSNDKEEIFWKWHLVPDSEAEKLVGNVLNPQVVVEEVVEPVIEEKIVEIVEVPKPKAKPIVNEEIKVVVKEEIKPVEIVEPKEEIIHIKEEKPKKKTVKPKKVSEDFKTEIINWCSSKEIEIVNFVDEIEYECIVNVPSKIGKVKFFAKFSNKAKVNDTDLGLVRSDLPILYISKGELTKKGKEFSEKHNISFEKI
jgi:hypothetical protein